MNAVCSSRCSSTFYSNMSFKILIKHSYDKDLKLHGYKYPQLKLDIKLLKKNKYKSSHKIKHRKILYEHVQRDQ